MLDASEHLDPSEVRRLMREASMPAREADNEFLDALVQTAPENAGLRGIDWIRFGQLLRDELGWEKYPEVPPT
jgi:hypothetical protein